jgi:hypothetical protein
MSYSNSFNIGADNLVLGSATGIVNISSLGGEDILINGVSPGGGGGGVPAVGDIDFIGNLNCNDTAGGGTKGIITAEKKINSGLGGIQSVGDIKTLAGGDLKSGRDILFNGQDIYKTYEGIEPQPANKTYKEYRKLVATDDNSIFTGTNKFRNNAVSIQALNTDVPAVFVDKITLNTDGNINCNELNNATLLKSNSIICENGPTESQKVMARQYHFRPNSLETTGWVFSQKAPEAGAPAADNYLMLQNTQATGSLNLVKSTFDPENPTPFDIVLDPQNGQVKTATSFDAPKVNFRKNATDSWSISQPAAGDPAQATLIARAPSVLGSFNILDDNSSPWAQFSSLSTTLPKATTINATLNVNGNTTLGSANSLLFGAYIFRPQQFYKDITDFSFNHSAIGSTNLLFNTGEPPVQEWTNVNTGATNQAINLINNPGAYKITIRQTTNGSQNEINGMRVMSDIVLSRPNDPAPIISLPSPTAYSYELYNGVSGGNAPGAPIITMVPGGLTWAVHCTFPQTSNNETANIRVTLTHMPYFA